MERWQNHWVALYLSGKYPGFFRTPDKLFFIDSLQSINPTAFSDEKIKMLGLFGLVDEYEFYYSFLNKIERDFSDQFIEFLDILNVPKEIRNIWKVSFNHIQLLNEFKITKGEQNSQAKGKAFEEFLKKFFGSIEGLEVIEIKQASDEQIDLVLKNNVNRPFWIQLGSPLFIGEAKNWTNKTPTEVFNTLRGKMDGHKNFSRIGIVIAMKGFTEEVSKNLIRDGAGEKIIFPITGDNIESLLISKIDPIDWLEEKITWAFR